ncbi:hypothetical protein [Arthrobacter crystallopoietes]|uniref:TrbL/VirB6 plasmid conjugal transfer protein n=1 Tax=Crystallibacter crystallopoietes TaxID=37928 RepID=A0A1H1HZT3_9MICC|nr:hypothetical protein [Arthrobacter crystallopoietes]SDR30954.1 hypothetical protein SAMN04489742_4855 [Arthrobacter crystallopoietes]
MSLAVLSVIIGGTRMVWEQRGAPLKDLLRSLLTLTLVSGMGLAVIAILVEAADAFSRTIIDTATDGEGFATAIREIAVIQDGDAIFLLIVLGLISLLTSLVQIVLMIVRGGMLVILAGILPTTAAFTNMEMGRQWFQKAVGWTLAFILYKPAASMVYGAAFVLMESNIGEDALLGSITGISLMILAVLALPALMRFVTPLVGAVAAGSNGGSGAAAGAAVGALATGAINLGRSGSGRGSASPTPPSQPPGSGTAGKVNTGASKTGQSGGTATNAKPTPGGAAQNWSKGAAAPTAASAAGGGSSGAAAGPVGLAASTGIKLATKAGEAAQKTAQDSTGEGPSGSN